MPLELYDNTRISDHRKCNRFSYFRHQLNFVPDNKAYPLIFGDCWHHTMDVTWLGIHKMPNLTNEELTEIGYQAFIDRWIENEMPHPADMDDDLIRDLKGRTPDTAFFMLGNYIKKRRSFIKQLELLEVEKPFAVPLSTGNPNLFYVGRLDKVTRWENRIWVFEHKTTSWGGAKSGISGVYIESFSPDSQIDGYHHAGHMLYGNEFKGVMIDVAFVNKSSHDHFMFLPIERSINNLDAWLWEVKVEISRMETNHNNIDLKNQDSSNFMKAYPKNTGSCIQFMRPCPYMDICKTVPNPESLNGKAPLGFKVSKWEPFEELKLEKLNLEQQK